MLWNPDGTYRPYPQPKSAQGVKVYKSNNGGK